MIPIRHSRAGGNPGGSEVDCGSGFPAAIITTGVSTIRGWKAAPTIKLTLNILS